MTTQSPHLYERQTGPAGGTAKAAAQTRLTWWGLALPVAAFTALLVLVGSGSAHGTPTASGGDLLRHLAGLGAAVLALLGHLV
ncbi:hypothetical protein [Actinacidiphila guanduensis]|uniref:Uncharacterized protein n=1 Tax=Actinacidiphila guanduensis TaxID=310781 RepID=A0A1H0E820_9ACTN|nr:hypothetical protein [Actinacidiphila guanduensis]SDN78463.1 hypothetical protein SAMN05216259_105507 [Actinacidiphila guanduensis]